MTSINVLICPKQTFIAAVLRNKKDEKPSYFIWKTQFNEIWTNKILAGNSYNVSLAHLMSQKSENEKKWLFVYECDTKKQITLRELNRQLKKIIVCFVWTGSYLLRLYWLTQSVLSCSAASKHTAAALHCRVTQVKYQKPNSTFNLFFVFFIAHSHVQILK